jgi:rhamnosyltransferase
MFSSHIGRSPKAADVLVAPTVSGKLVAPEADPRPSANSVVAVIVTYHPDPGLQDRVRPLVGQVGAIVVVDNGSRDAELASVDSLERDGVAVTIRNGRNLGIAVALNQGVAWAAEHGYAWAVTFDQDTTPGPDVVSEAARVFDAFPDPSPAVIGATWDPNWCAADPGRPEACVITAGALHSVRAWSALGRFREDFFIDYVDTEFCLRARANGYSVLVACRPTIRHAIGSPSRHETPFRSFTPSNHNRVRRYYITRNRVHVWRTYWRSEPRYVAYDAKAAVKELVKLVLFEEDRRRKLRAIARGVRDGLRGVTGPLSPA